MRQFGVAGKEAGGGDNARIFMPAKQLDVTLFVDLCSDFFNYFFYFLFCTHNARKDVCFP